MILQTHSLKSFQNDISLIETIKEKVDSSKKNKKSFLKITYINAKVFFWNLSPMHWYDSFNEIKIDLNEFECKKNKL